MAEVLLTVEELAAQAFNEHSHVNTVWVDEVKQEWHIHSKKGLVEVKRTEETVAKGKKSKKAEE